MGARVFNLALGVWLALSALVWGNPQGARLNALICGIAVAVISAVSLVRRPVVKYLDTVLAIWLFFSGFAFSRKYDNGFVWNVVIVAFALFISSLAPIVNERPFFRVRGRRIVEA